MKSDVEQLSATHVKLTVEVPFAELEPHMAKAYRAISQQATVPGFRRGKVPQRIIDQRFGRGVVLEEAVNEALPQFVDSAVTEAGLTTAGQPKVEVTDLTDGESLSFTVEVDVVPDFDLPAFESLNIEVPGVDATDADIDAEVDGLRGRFATLVPVDRAVAEGDVVVVDLAGSCEGEDVEDLTASAMSMEVGADDMLPGFTEAVVGAQAGDVRTLVIPAESGEFAGKEIIVTISVSRVQERELPEADDDFAQLASEFDTIAELREDLRERIVRRNRFSQGSQAREKVHEALLQSVDFPLPESLVTAEIEGHFEDGHGEPEHRAEFEVEARERIKSTIILDRIAKDENLSVSQEELSAWLIQQASRYQMTPDQFADALVRAGQVDAAVAEVRRRKALAVVLDKATIVDESGQIVNLTDLEADLQAALAAAGAAAQ